MLDRNEDRLVYEPALYRMFELLRFERWLLYYTVYISERCSKLI